MKSVKRVTFRRLPGAHRRQLARPDRPGGERLGQPDRKPGLPADQPGLRHPRPGRAHRPQPAQLLGHLDRPRTADLGVRQRHRGSHPLRRAGQPPARAGRAATRGVDPGAAVGRARSRRRARWARSFNPDAGWLRGLRRTACPPRPVPVRHRGRHHRRLEPRRRSHPRGHRRGPVHRHRPGRRPRRGLQGTGPGQHPGRQVPLRHQLPLRHHRGLRQQLPPGQQLHRPHRPGRFRPVRDPQHRRQPVRHLRQAGRGQARRRRRPGQRLRRRVRRRTATCCSGSPARARSTPRGQ